MTINTDFIHLEGKEHHLACFTQARSLVRTKYSTLITTCVYVEISYGFYIQQCVVLMEEAVTWKTSPGHCVVPEIWITLFEQQPIGRAFFVPLVSETQ